jgi:hypothetical protein
VSSHFLTSADALARAFGSTRITRSINNITANNKLTSLFKTTSFGSSARTSWEVTHFQTKEVESRYEIGGLLIRI